MNRTYPDELVHRELLYLLTPQLCDDVHKGTPQSIHEPRRQKTCLCNSRATNAKTSLRIRAD